MRNNGESAEQKKLVKWLRLYAFVFYHSPSEMPIRDGAEKAIRWLRHQEAMGWSKGFPDLLIFGRWKGGEFIKTDVAIEMKYGTNKPSREQNAWGRQLHSSLWCYYVCYSADEAIEHLKGWL